MIYECNGIAGSGKTTLAKNILKVIRQSNHSANFIGVATFRGAQQTGISKYAVKLERLLLPFKSRNFSFFLKCLRYYYSASRSKRYLNSNYESYIALLYCVYLFDAYRKSQHNDIVSDEGMLQALTTFSLTREGKISLIVDLLKQTIQLHSKIVFINCQISLPLAIDRMKIRNRHDSAIDELSIPAQESYLSAYQERLKKLRAQINNQACFEADMSEASYSLAKKLKGFKEV